MALYGGSAAPFALLHCNIPGVLPRVEALIAEHGLNVDGQVFATRGEIGYVMTDVSGDMPRPWSTPCRRCPRGSG